MGPARPLKGLFPAASGFFGGWFGGPLVPLFGPGIRDIPLTGNRPGRFAPGVVHTRYFSYPDSDDADGVAVQVRHALALDLHAELVALKAPQVNPKSASL